MKEEIAVLIEKVYREPADPRMMAIIQTKRASDSAGSLF